MEKTSSGVELELFFPLEFGFFLEAHPPYPLVGNEPPTENQILGKKIILIQLQKMFYLLSHLENYTFFLNKSGLQKVVQYLMQTLLC